LVRISARLAWFFVAFGVWTWVIWPVFIKNIAADPRSFQAGSPTGFFLVHLVLTVVSFVAGTAIGVVGIRALLARRSGKNATDLTPNSPERINS
jgi:hypothetical protein